MKTMGISNINNPFAITTQELKMNMINIFFSGDIESACYGNYPQNVTCLTWSSSVSCFGGCGLGFQEHGSRASFGRLAK